MTFLANRPPYACLRSKAVSLVVSLGLLFPPMRPARADEPLDTALLVNGRRFRGSVMEEDPKKGTSIKLPDGTVRRVAAAEVKQVIYASATEPPAPSGVAAPAVPPSAPAAVPVTAPPAATAVPVPGQGAQPTTPAVSVTPEGSVMVAMESNDPNITLDRITGSMSSIYVSGVTIPVGQWQTECRAPCGKRLDRTANYVIHGIGIVPSKAFGLGEKDAVTFHVKAGSQAAAQWGFLLTATGAGVALAGAILLPVGAAVDNTTGSLYGPAGGVCLALGLLMLLPGIPLLATSGTHVYADDGRQLAKVTEPPHAPPHLTSRGFVF
jgi:hypothetical protein